MYKSEIQLWKISDLEEAREVVNSNPVHQRPQRGKTSNNTAKSQGIIRSLMQGVRSMITICKVDDGCYEFESIDGGHRKRAIISYLNCEFPVKMPEDGKEKLFRELTEEQRKQFRDILLPVCVYEDLSGSNVGNIFRSLNTTDRVSHQEMLNSYGDTPIANAVRGTVRHVDGYTLGLPHSLFEYNLTKSNNIVYSYISFNNEELRQEQWVARLFYYYLNGEKITPCDESDLEKMYDSNPDQTVVDSARSKVYEILTYVQRHATYRLQDVGSTFKTSDKIANLFIRLRFYITGVYGKMPQFSKDTGRTERDFHHSVMAVYNEIIAHKDVMTWNGFTSTESSQSIGSKFSKNLSEYRYDNDESTMYPVKMILSKINVADYLLIKDNKRTASKQERESLLYEQKFIDPISGKKINADTAQADHVIPHAAGLASGGVTEKHNLMMVSKEYNQAKSDKMPIETSKIN